MEEENKMSFWQKLKISIFKLEEYQKLAIQKLGKTIGYLAKLMLIFVFFFATILTFQFSNVLKDVKEYVENNISEINFEDNTLKITAKENSEEAIIIEDEKILNGKLIIDTNDLTEEEINNYVDEVKNYTNGIIVLRDKLILNTSSTSVSSNIYYQSLFEQYNIVKLDKQDIINMLSGSNVWIMYASFFVVYYIYLYIIYFSSVLIDSLLYSILGYITGLLSKLNFKYSAVYNIAVHSLTLPIILNLIYLIINVLTGYTIKYFDIMYIAITCIYIITAVLMIKSDVIKKQMELSKIISEQEKVKAEMERKEQEKKEEEEKERTRKEDEKKRQEEKKKKEEDKKGDSPQPEANIVTKD